MSDEFGGLLDLLNNLFSSPEQFLGGDAVSGDDLSIDAFWSDAEPVGETSQTLAEAPPWGAPAEPISAEGHMPLGTTAEHDASLGEMSVDASHEDDSIVASALVEDASDAVDDALGHEAIASEHRDIEPVIAVGDPAGDAVFWHAQEDANSCAVAAQRGVIESVTGQLIPEGELAELAASRGWYDPSCGTTPDAVGRLLETYDVPVASSYDTRIEDLYDALIQNEKVIVGLDSNEIMNQIVDDAGNPVELPDMGHAVWVTGMEMDADGQVQVVLNDPGHAAGAGARVPLKHFENAWDDFGRYAVVTQTGGDDIV
ncbi:MAG: hypothetical protein M0R76_11225 [Proteobacteria bacterium]|nr:hypothetical protein [Pseudomonadota bacterium]